MTSKICPYNLHGFIVNFNKFKLYIARIFYTLHTRTLPIQYPIQSNGSPKQASAASTYIAAAASTCCSMQPKQKPSSLVVCHPSARDLAKFALYGVMRAELKNHFFLTMLHAHRPTHNTKCFTLVYLYRL